MDEWAGETGARGLFSIGAVSRLTGIAPSTLRSWERRYGFPAPPRRQSGHRLYSSHEVRLLESVLREIEQGRPASLAIEAVRSQSNQAEEQEAGRIRALRARFIAACRETDALAAGEALREAWGSLTWRALTREFILPVQQRVGELWHGGEMSVAGEHLSSNLIRREILAFLRFLGDARQAPSGVLACAPSETHELGLLVLGGDLRLRGWHVIYLGQAAPLDDAIRTARQARAAALFLSATTAPAAVELLAAPERAVALGAGGLRLLAGGAAVDAIRERLPQGLRAVSASELDETLHAIEREQRLALS